MRSYHKFLDTLKCPIDKLEEDSSLVDLYSIERLEELATSLAKDLETGTDKKIKRKSLRLELKDNTKLLDSAYHTLSSAMQKRETVSPASEWFVDNYHHIQDQLQDINQNLTHKYYKDLPIVLKGELKGYPRVYAIALVFVAHTDNHLTSDSLERFLISYQKSSTLLMEEIWALIITFRVVLIQHLTMRAMRLIFARVGKENADILVEQLFEYMGTPEINDIDIKNFLDNKIHDLGKTRRAFLVRLTQRLRDQSSDVSPAYDWIEEKLNDFSTDIETLTQKEIHTQAASQVSVGNIISSMRLISNLDWKVFFEKVNFIDPILKRDKEQIFETMDFTTKDRYRHSIGTIAKHSNMTEQEVAKKAVSYEGHVGYHLIGNGAKKFKKDCGYAPSTIDRTRESILSYPTFFYISLLGSISLLLLVPIILYFVNSGGGLVLGVTLGCISVLLTTELSQSVTNLYITYFIKPKTLPRLDPEIPLPDDAATMVVIPTLFTSMEAVDRMVETLEIHALANREENIYFALIGDFADANEEQAINDDIILNHAERRIKELNDKYFPDLPGVFHLFHRKRLWNESENRWIGWERKRGKISEFNQLLRGASDTSFIVATAPQELCLKIKYVITLDSDTELPRDSAKKLISTIIHPLNQPKIDPKTHIVKSGYGILQPRINISTSSSLRTYFSKISSGNTGIDPYTTAVSDVYQDLFQEGSYTGKGLYVVDTFELALKGRAPDNLVLSHDLFEGIFARCALVSDVELYDDYPADYDTFIKRCHRWVRGDWQILLWAFPWVINDERKWVKNRTSIISRWKIIDNLRRSLVPMATLLWLFLAWTVLPGSVLLWTLTVALIFLFPVYAPFASGQWLQRGNTTWQSHILSGLQETNIKLAQIFMTIAFLPTQAFLQCDAILRSLYRLLISKKSLLEWNPFSQSDLKSQFKTSVRDFFNPTSLTALISGIVIYTVRPEALIIYTPFFLIWLVNPLFKSLLNLSASEKGETLNTSEKTTYRFYARSTWYFFERFVSKRSHWLAPDNYQENPEPAIAYRTSPTNIGLQLLSYASAYDMGYLGREELINKLEKIFITLDEMPKIQGHFFNWYNIETLSPLYPRYISTVDSGNLAGHLMTLKQFLHGLKNTKRDYSILCSGLKDTVNLIYAQISQTTQKTPKHLQIELEAGINNLSQVLQGFTIQSHEQWSRTLDSIHMRVLTAKESLDYIFKDADRPIILDLLERLITQINEFQKDSDIDFSSLAQRESELDHKCHQLLSEMEFEFLFDDKRKLFFLGLNVEENRFDDSYYDLLASEARLASFVAIAKRDIPTENWFRLGRQVASVKGVRVLTSWSASMFEYLMPVLVMKRFENTLLDQSYYSVVKRQIEYGREKNIPWGISESAYNARDLQMNYQYGPFGVPGLGLKRGLSNELVVSPYSTMLAGMIRPKAALKNLKKLEKLGAFSTYGFYEAIDYTVERLPHKKSFSIIHSYMAHHQGMGLVSINNILNNNIMQKRFHSEPSVIATELLLQERIPKPVALLMPRKEEVDHSGFLHSQRDLYPRLYGDVNLSLPRTQILSNGHYSTLITSAGSGFSNCDNFSLTRWREDSTRDNWGQYYYVRSSSLDEYWSTTFQPLCQTPKKYFSDFSEDRVRLWRDDKNITTKTEIVVSPEDNVELRKMTITNETSTAQKVELTSFMELALIQPNDDKAHPSFSKLFIQTKRGSNKRSLIATRRQRSDQQKKIWAFHTTAFDLPLSGPIEFETDRLLFIGRGRTPKNPLALENEKPLSQSLGSVLDPIFSLRLKFTIPAGQSLRIVFSTGMAENESQALEHIEKYSDIYNYKRESEMAWTHAQVQLRHLNISPLKSHIYQKLAGRILYLDNSLRANSQTIIQNTRTQADLWRYGISGDFPILLVEVNNEKDLHLIKDLLKAHEYLRLKGLIFDLVVLNLRSVSYLLSLQDELLRQVRMSGCQGLIDKHGGIFILRFDLMPREDILLLKSISRAILKGELGALKDQLHQRKPRLSLPLLLKAQSETPLYNDFDIELPKLEFFNGLGGFSLETNEYVIFLRKNEWTPAPWINVIANSLDFGFIISDSGASHTWSVNSRENKITPWFNDPVSDPSGEILYIRDEKTGDFWSPTPLPIRSDAPYVIRHGQGYSKFYHISREIEQSLKVFVKIDEEVKITELTLKNLGSSTRSLSITSYIEWVLGVYREDTAAHVVTEYDNETSAVFAHNSYNNEFSSRYSFIFMSSTATDLKQTYTCDRREFLGRNGDYKNPKSLKRKDLSCNSGAGFDPCTALQSTIELRAGQEEKIIILIGQANTREKGQMLIKKYGDSTETQKAFREVISYWNTTLGKVEIETPDLSMNTLVNRWLPYQILSCRIWGRTALYQSGGAFGFRDQLQDAMAMVYSRPEITRDQILTHAKRQFKEGDVQHWWHPPTGRGVRTHFSDDLLWLPFTVNYYIKRTGDYSILDETTSFLEGPLLGQDQEDAYIHPEVTDEKETVFEHCARALDRSLKLGVHGLPLIGGGDWNDGMNRIGHEGKGESVWVAWFLHQTLSDFLPLCQRMNEHQRLNNYSEHITKIKNSLEQEAWDGQWYRRAFFDDGTPVGSRLSEECKIDSISQSWAILSNAGNNERALQAMQEVEKSLINWENKIVKLLSPPFDKTIYDPGYIKGYVPGVRENGGQYTHAAIWVMMAYAKLGDGEKATRLFQLLNPINHCLDQDSTFKYKVEPYALAADVYSLEPHVGRGGWSWYTGSASWMYRAALESILGLEVEANKFRVCPKVPESWDSFRVTHYYGNTLYEVILKRNECTFDHQGQEWIEMVDDGKKHIVEISF